MSEKTIEAAKWMSLAASVEITPGRRRPRSWLTEGAGLEIQMVDLVARTAPNIDSYLIELSKLCAKRGFSMDASPVIRDFTGSDYWYAQVRKSILQGPFAPGAPRSDEQAHATDTTPLAADLLSLANQQANNDIYVYQFPSEAAQDEPVAAETPRAKQ